jgi:hypothetical protein
LEKNPRIQHHKCSDENGKKTNLRFGGNCHTQLFDRKHIHGNSLQNIAILNTFGKRQDDVFSQYIIISFKLSVSGNVPIALRSPSKQP